ncbi:hypothetical protein Lal_00019565 [Lupinus albus]|nr:hypothetical protein Lal_00019565 [Lupinus albus]
MNLNPSEGTLEVFSPMFHRWTAGGRQDRVLSHDAAATLIWSSLVFYVWRALLDLEELVGLKGCFPTRPEDSVEMSTAKGTSSGSIEEGGEKKKFTYTYFLLLRAAGPLPHRTEILFRNLAAIKTEGESRRNGEFTIHNLASHTEDDFDLIADFILCQREMMPELELVESLLVTDVGAFSALVGVATLGAFGLRKQIS